MLNTKLSFDEEWHLDAYGCNPDNLHGTPFGVLYVFTICANKPLKNSVNV